MIPVSEITEVHLAAYWLGNLTAKTDPEARMPAFVRRDKMEIPYVIGFNAYLQGVEL